MSFISRLINLRMQTLFEKVSAPQINAIKDDHERLINAIKEDYERLESELSACVKASTASIKRQIVFAEALRNFQAQVSESYLKEGVTDMADVAANNFSDNLRRMVREAAGLEGTISAGESLQDLLAELEFIRINKALLRPVLQSLSGKRVLYSGQAYYNNWYLSRALRMHGWKADVLNWDTNLASQIYYHGEDYRFDGTGAEEVTRNLSFYVTSLYSYDIFHFSNAHGICFGLLLQALFEQHFGRYSEIRLLKDLGKKIVYSNNGCLDGVSQSSFAKWGPESVCSICRWRSEPMVCSDERNLEWGEFRNSVADFQCHLGGNRVDYNDDPRVHEVPEFYCLDKDFWHSEIEIPDAFRLPPAPPGTVWLYHAVGNGEDRTAEDGVNIKSSHIYLPLIKKLKEQGLLLELIAPTGIPNRDVRFLQAQADIFLDMLTFGWFGANVREAMMLGKPVICFVRPEWLESLRQEIPDYAKELPVVSATPDTVEEVLLDLIANPEKRREIGQRGREFAVKWHSAEAGGRRFDEIYGKLLQGNPHIEKGLP